MADELSKPWWQSRTIWLNVGVALFAAAEAQLHWLQSLLPVNVYAVIAFGLPVINMALRAVTSQAVSLGSKV